MYDQGRALLTLSAISFDTATWQVDLPITVGKNQTRIGMEKLVPIIEGFFRPRDNYATGARATAFLVTAVAVLWIKAAIDRPWLIALIVAGLLNLFALIFNTIRTRRERPLAALNEAREHLRNFGDPSGGLFCSRRTTTWCGFLEGKSQFVAQAGGHSST